MKHLFREPSHHPYSWLYFLLALLIGSTGFRDRVAGLGLIINVSSVVGVVLVGLSDVLPKQRIRTAGFLRIVGILSAIICLASFIALATRSG